MYFCSSFSFADGAAFFLPSYFAAKDCSYTDSTGRPVPAPNAARAGAANPQLSGASNRGLSVALAGDISSPFAPQDAHHALAEPQHASSALALQTGVAGPSHFGSTTSSSAPFASPIHVSPVETTRPRAAQFHNADLVTAPPPPSSAPRKRLKGDSEIYDRDQAFAAQAQIPTPVSASGGPSRLTIAAPEKIQSHAQYLDPSGHLMHQLTHRKSSALFGLKNCPSLSLIAAAILDAFMEHHFHRSDVVRTIYAGYSLAPAAYLVINAPYLTYTPFYDLNVITTAFNTTSC